MTDFRSDLQDLVSRHVARAPAAKLLRLVEALNGDSLATRMERIVIPAERFTRLDSKGSPTMDAQDEFVAVYDAETDLTWLAEPVGAGARYNWKAALEACAAVRMFGKSDWRAPTIQELLSIVDYDRSDPAVDTAFFKGPHDWTWSSTEAKSLAGLAWFVYLDGGYSGRDYQTNDFLVRAVRSGQQLGILD